MQLIDFTMDDPAMDIALDEALLIEAERGNRPEVLRFWSSGRNAVVIGRGQDAAQTVRLEACRENGVPVMRRFSGGGAVLLAPGVLCYTYIMEYEKRPGTRDLRKSYEVVGSLLKEGLRRIGVESEIQPLGDLAAGGRKISGNAQARRRKYFLQHGTLLVMPLVKLIDRYLPHPPEEPEYRQGRTHADFLSNLRHLGCDASLDDVKRSIIAASAISETSSPTGDEIAMAQTLAASKYFNDNWNLNGTMPRT